MSLNYDNFYSLFRDFEKCIEDGINYNEYYLELNKSRYLILIYTASKYISNIKEMLNELK